MTQLHLGWHFCSMRDVPVLRDGTPLEIGRMYEYTDQAPLMLCKRGYHDSERVIDALGYAPGAYLCRTLSSADVTDDNKRVSRYRQAIAGFDATRTLHVFAVRIAYCVLLDERARGREPDPRSWNALNVKSAWLRGDATDDELSAARSEAWSAARSEAWSAAKSAANQMLLDMLPKKLVQP